MTLSRLRKSKPNPVNHSVNNQESFIKPSVEQMMNKDSETNSVQKEEDQVQMKTDFFGNPAFIQPSSSVQARLRMGKPNDPYEKEADQMADQVVQNPEATSKKPNIQRVASEPSDEVQKKSMDDESIQKSASFEKNLGSSKGKGAPMDDSTKGSMENGFGHEFNDVRIHTDSNAVQLNNDIGAKAFTNGNDIYFNEGNYDPKSQGGKHLLAHELTHTVQQGKGTTDKTVQRSENEGEFEVYKAHRLKMYDQQIAAIPEGPDREKAVKKLTKERDKFDKKATRFSSKMTKKGGWDDEGFEEKRDKKFGSDYDTTIDDKKRVVKEGISSTVSSITSTINTSTSLMSKAISASELDSGTAEKLLKEAEVALNDARVISQNVTAANDADDAHILSELDSIIKKLVILVDTIRKNVDGLKADQTTFTAVITSLEAQQTTLDKLMEKTNNEDDVQKLIAIQDTELPLLKTSIDATNTAANGTKPATTLIDEPSTSANIEALKIDLVTRLTWLEKKSKDSGKAIKYSTIKPLITDGNVEQADRDALKTHAVVGKSFFMKFLTRANVVEVMADLKFDLKTQIEWVRTVAGVKEVKQVIDAASAGERDLVWKDAAYLNTLYTAVGDDYYLWVISKLRMKHVGTITHTSALDADTAIQTHLSAYVTAGVAAGRQIEGMVAIVDDVNWKIAGEARYGATVWATKSLAGFVDTKERVWIYMDAGNIATMIHEGVHKYSDDKLIKKSQPLNEGVTEYFTRLAANGAGLNISSRNNYRGNYATTVKLVALVGEAKVAKAYFDGDVAGLKAEFIAKKSAADWRNFLIKTKAKNWSAADGYL